MANLSQSLLSLLLSIAFIFPFQYLGFASPSRGKDILKPATPIIDPHQDDEFLNAEVQSAYLKHLEQNVCAEMKQGGAKIYNKVYELMKWIEDKRKLKYDTQIPVCTPLRDNFAQDYTDYLLKNREIVVKIGETYKAYGLLMESIDYYSEMIRNAKEVWNGYWEPGNYKIAQDGQGKDTVVPTGRIVVNASKSISEDLLVHELTHALQRRHFPAVSSNVYKDRVYSGFELTAKKAMTEAEASLNQWIYAAEYGYTTDIPDRNEFIISANSLLWDGGNIPLINAQRAIYYQLSVPFILEIMGDTYNSDCISSMLDSRPPTAEQIINPQKYLTDEKTIFEEDFDIGGFENFFDAYKYIREESLYDSFGVLGYAVFLSNRGIAVDINNTAKGLTGDRTFILGPRSQKEYDWAETIFVWLTVWDSPSDAQAHSNTLDHLIWAKHGPVKTDSFSKNGASYKIHNTSDQPSVKYALNARYENRTVFIERLPAEHLNDFLALPKESVFDFIRE